MSSELSTATDSGIISASSVPTSPKSSAPVQPAVVRNVRTTRALSSSSAKPTVLQRFMMGKSTQKKKSRPSPQAHQQHKSNNGKSACSSAPAYDASITAETSPYAYLYPGAGSTKKKARPYDEVTARSSRPINTGCISLIMSGKNVLATQPRPAQETKVVRGEPASIAMPPKDAATVIRSGYRLPNPAMQLQQQRPQQRRRAPQVTAGTAYRGTARPPTTLNEHRFTQKPSCSTIATSTSIAQTDTSTTSETSDSTLQHRSPPPQSATSNKRSRQASEGEGDEDESEQDIRSATKRRRFSRKRSDEERDTIVAAIKDDELSDNGPPSSCTSSYSAKQQPSATGSTSPQPCKGVAVYVSGHRSPRTASKGSSSPKSNFFHKGQRLAANPFIKA